MNIYIIGHKSPDLDAVASTIEYKEYLEKIGRYSDYDLIPVTAGNINKETQYVLDTFGVDIPSNVDHIDINKNDKFILMDHNEIAQRHEKVHEDQVIEIADHHKININFSAPLRIDVRPLGSTSTLVYELYETNGLEPTDKTKGLILASILSDTVGLKSPTTTGLDSKIAHKLSDELDIDVNEFTYDIFKAKSDLDGLTNKEIVMKDYKVFEFTGNKVFIGVVETVDQKKLLEKQKELVEALKEVKDELGVVQGYLAIQDILNVNSQVIYETEKEAQILEKAFMAQRTNGVVDIGPKLSRKKEIAPAIEEAQN